MIAPLRFATAALAAALSLPASAFAFVCSQVAADDGTSEPSLSWFTRELTYSLNAAGTEAIAGLQELDELRASFQLWEVLEATDVVTCPSDVIGTDITFAEQPLSSSTFVGFNHLQGAQNENLLVFRDDGWPHEGSSSASIVALTTTTFSRVTGEIFDADIEFNSALFDFALQPNSSQFDLKSTAAHEIGHFLGLGHSIANSSPGLDHEAAREATMNAQTQGGDTKKRDLTCDDTKGIAFKYPRNQANGYCPPGETCPNAGSGCYPPQDLDKIASVRVTSRSDGLSGGCMHVNNTAWSLTLLALLARRLRKKTPNA